MCCQRQNLVTMSNRVMAWEVAMVSQMSAERYQSLQKCCMCHVAQMLFAENQTFESQKIR